MRTRKDILQELILGEGDLNEIKRELSMYGWDSENPIVTITTEIVLQVLNKCIKGELSLFSLTLWANLIECRDDIDFESDEIQELIFYFASPEINGKIELDYIRKLAEASLRGL